jgi:hypothetical protein
VTGLAPFHLATGVAEQYETPSSSACFTLADPEAAIVFEHRGRECTLPTDPEACGGGGTGLCPQVIDKVFPTFRVDVAVAHDGGADPDPTDALCEPDLPAAWTDLTGDGSLAIADVQGGAVPDVSYACLIGEVSRTATDGRPLLTCAVDADDLVFDYTMPEAEIAFSPERHHVDITVLVDGEPMRSGRGAVVIDDAIGINAGSPQNACNPRYVVTESRPFACTSNFPYAAVTCQLEQDLGGGSFRVAATKSGASCAAVADSRGGFTSGNTSQISWTTELDAEPAGSYRTVITVTDFHGNQATLTVAGCTNV